MNLFLKSEKFILKPLYLNKYLLNINNEKKNYRLWKLDGSITLDSLKKKFLLYDGKKLVPFHNIKDTMQNFRFGEFVLTKKRPKFKGKK